MQEKLTKIKLLALDVDGVLTDGTINIGDNGELFKGKHLRVVRAEEILMQAEVLQDRLCQRMGCK